MYITRALEPVIRTYSDHFGAILVTGPRQVGKTTMLRHLAEQDAAAGRQRAYVTLDNGSTRALAVEDPELFLQRYRPPLLIDEIQKAPELLPYVKIAIDEIREPGLFWLTGSQPLHLMKAVSESLAGRIGIVEMRGLSNAEISGMSSVPYAPSPEYFTARVEASSPFGIDEAFARIAAGSLPALRELPTELRAAGFDSYIDTYIMRDIRDLAQVGDELRFRRFVCACAALTSKPVVYAELARLADVDEKTAKRWLSLLTSSYVVQIVEPYANNLLKRLVKQPIMHFTDTGLAAHLAGWSNAIALETGAFAGQIFETYVFNEISKSYINAGLKPPLWYFRNNDKKEIDLLLERDGALFPIEVKKKAAPNKADLKNFGALAPVAADDVPAELASFKRTIGTGSVVCMASDAYPISNTSWAFPAWAI